MTREAVIVSTARTPIGKAYRGAFNDTDAPTMGGHVIAAAVQRAGIDPAEIQDVVMGCAMQQGSSGQNIAAQRASQQDFLQRVGYEYGPSVRIGHDGYSNRR